MPSLATSLATTPRAKEVGVVDGVGVADALSEGLEVPAGDDAIEVEHEVVKISVAAIPAAAMICRDFIFVPLEELKAI
jgi:hypothetical protein